MEASVRHARFGEEERILPLYEWLFGLDTGLARTDAQRFYQRREPASVGYSYLWRL